VIVLAATAPGAASCVASPQPADARRHASASGIATTMAARGRMRRGRGLPFDTEVLLIVAAESSRAIVEGVAILTAYGVTVNDPTMP
jgi:cytochrome c556